MIASLVFWIAIGGWLGSTLVAVLKMFELVEARREIRRLRRHFIQTIGNIPPRSSVAGIIDEIEWSRPAHVPMTKLLEDCLAEARRREGML